MKIQPASVLFAALLCGVCSLPAAAQLNPLNTQYYTNAYLANPAMAGKDPGFRSYAVGSIMFANLPGAPVTQHMTGSYGFKRTGIGISVNSQKAGLQRETRVLGTFAYHLPLSEGSDKLHFGISMGFMHQRLSVSDINANTADIMIGQYNDRPTYLDGDFGAAYTGKRLTVEAAIPNLKGFLKRDAIALANVATFYSAISYLLPLGKSSLDLEPKLVFRGVSGLDNIWDAGARLSFANRQLFFTTLYHSNRSATFGMELDFMKKYHFGSMYTTNSGELNRYVNGGFEINLGLTL